MSLQEALRQMRMELGITQTDLAQKLNKSFPTVSRWENGKSFPSRDNAKNILKVAKAGNVSADCYDYLSETLMPDVKRGKSAGVYGFPDIDRDFLFQLADGSTNELYVVEAGTYNLLYANRKAEKAAAQYLLDRGEFSDERKPLEQTADRRCFHYFGNRDCPCPFCPLEEVEFDAFTDKTLAIPETKRVLRIHAKMARMKERLVYAVYLTDITERDAEANALYELTNDIPGGVGIYHLHNDDRVELVFMNEVLFQMIGAERKEELLKGGGSDLRLVHPEDRNRLWEEIHGAISEQRRVGIVLRMRVIDGRYHVLRIDGRMIKKDADRRTFYCLLSDLGQAE